MKHFTLYELHQFIERVFLLNFEEKIWIEAEIAELQINNGHYYITLVEKDNHGGLLAQTSVFLWRDKVERLRNKLEPYFDQILTVGRRVKVYCEVKFHPRYGYNLHLFDLDLDHSLGNLYRAKQEALARLTKENLITKNKELTLPPAIQHIAIISSPTAAGYQDFVQQLQSNPYQYQIHFDLFSSKMQGDQTAVEVERAIDHIRPIASKYDAIFIVRGGGSQADLSDFDQYEIAHSIAHAPLPVISGIGHDKNQSLTDVVAFHSVKTPTAAAEYLLQYNLTFETACMDLFEQIKNKSRLALRIEQDSIQLLQYHISPLSYKRLQLEKQWLLDTTLNNYTKIAKVLNQEKDKIFNLSQKLSKLNPKEITKHGYAIIEQDHRWIKELTELSLEDPITIQLNSKKLTVHAQKESTQKL